VGAEAVPVEAPRPRPTAQGDQFSLSRNPAVHLCQRVDHRVSVTEVAPAFTGVAHATTSLHQRTGQGRTSRVGTEGRTGVVLVVVVQGLSTTLGMMERGAENPEHERVHVVAGVSRPELGTLANVLPVLRALHGLEPLDVQGGQVDDHRGAAVHSGATDLIAKEEGGEVVSDGVCVGHRGSRARSGAGTTPPHTYNITSSEDLAST